MVARRVTSKVVIPARLSQLGLAYRARHPWLVVGDGPARYGWKLHLSTIQSDCDDLLERVLPVLKERGFHFKVARDTSIIAALNSGELGETQVGKFITIYPQDDDESLRLGQTLVAATADLRGPAVPSDAHLGGVVYTRFGAFEPEFLRDRLGNVLSYMRLADGRLVRDEYQMPFQTPDGIENPFEGFATFQSHQAETVPMFGPGYRVVDVLQARTTGSVLLALDLRDRTTFGVTVLKQARAFCNSDEFGRDLRDRLRHQERLHRLLAHLEQVPCAGSYFEVEETGYLPIEFVEGETLESYAATSLGGRPLAAQPLERREAFVKVGIDLIDAVAGLHAAGVVHRDLAARNVLVGSEGQIHLIDFELAHHMVSADPPFAKGTPGFMSPSQEAGDAPCEAHDVYATGCLLVLLLTGIDPRRMVHDGGAKTVERLARWTGLAPGTYLSTIVSATGPHETERPSLEVLREAMSSVLECPPARRSTRRARTSSALESVVSRGLAGLQDGVARDDESGLWLSPRLDGHEGRGSGPSRFEIRRDANRGVSGVVFTIARLGSFGFADPSISDSLPGVISWLREADRASDLPGLHFGRCGVAVAIVEASCNGMVTLGADFKPWLDEVLDGPLDWPDLTHGAAGQGMAALYCAERLDSGTYLAAAGRCARYLVALQNSDGSWTLPDGVPGLSGQIVTGFAHGVAGIVHFLAEYGSRTDDADALRAAERGADWLLQEAIEEGGERLAWRYSDQDPAIWKWWCHGAPGVALTLLKLFELSGERRYADSARRALHAHPEPVRHPNLSQCHGLAGLGEIYLEASRVLADESFFLRAQDLGDLLASLAKPLDSGTLVWIVEDPSLPSADLMVGGGGVLHFLARLHGEGRQGAFPLLIGPSS